MSQHVHDGVERQPGLPDRRARAIVGVTAVSFSALYFLSDVIEYAQGGFSTGQLWLTLVAEAAIPGLVVGIALVQRNRLGRLGLVSAFAYAYSYVVFTGTVGYALVHDTPNYQTLSDDLGSLMIVHGAVMVVAGLGFGCAVWRARTLPRWTAAALMCGVVLVSLTQTSPEGVQLAAAGVRALGLAGMGAALLLIESRAAAA